MDRNREARRVPMAAAGNGLSRRRHRPGGFRDSPEEEGPVELPEAARLRDRTKKERDRERDREREHRERDRLHSRSKRRRGERLIMVHDGGDESSEESVNDDEEYDDVKTIPPANNIFSSPLSNHHHQRKNFPPPSKNFRSPPSPALPVPSWKAAADEMIGVAVPRKARSACTKRPHESRTSNATGERSPARVLASPSPPSPSSSNVSARKKPLGTKQKPLPQKVSSPVAVQDEIEIEIAEVLYGMMRMPTSSKQEEKTTVDIKAKVSSPISITLAANSSSTNVSAIAPKRKKQRHVKYEEDENSSGLPSRVTKLEAEAPLRSQVPLGGELKRSGSAEDNSSVLDSTRESTAGLDSRSAEKIANKEDTVLPKVESSPGVRSDGDGTKPSSPEMDKFEIDLMAPPPGRSSSSERVGEMECVAAEAEPKATGVEMKPKPLLKEDGGSAAIVESEEKKKPRTVDEAEPHTSERSCELKLDLDKSGHAGVMNNQHVQKQPPPQQQQHFVPDKIAQANSLPLHMSMPGWPGGLPTMGYMPSTQGVVPTDTSSLSSAAMQPPPHLLFNQPRPKRCATHCYIARNIQSHQQFTKMNPFWPAAIGSAPLYGTRDCNLSLMPPTELQGTVLGRSSNQIQDENSKSTSKSSDTAQRKQILLQQALPPGAAANNIMHGPTFIFPMGQQPTMAAASVRPPNSGNTASSGATAIANSMNGSASATPAGAPTMTFSYPGMPGNETQYLAIMQNNGYPFQVPAHVGAPPAYRGAPGQPIPFFNGSFYSSQMIQSPFSQPQKQQQQSGQILQSHAPNNQNGSVSLGSSAAQKHLQNHQLRPHGNSDGYPTHKVQSQVLTFQQRQQPRENATQHSDTVGENSPSAADSRGSRSNVAYGQNYGMQMQPTNLGLMSSAAPGGGVVVSSSNHGEKKSQQQVSKAGAESFQSQGYDMTFATFNGVSSIAQNGATFQSLPEAARQGYQMMAANVAAQQKMNYSAPSEGKSGSNATAKTMEEQRKTEGASGKASGVNGGQSIAFSSKHDLGDASVSAVTSGSIVDTSRLLNLGSAQQQSTSSMPHHNLQQKMKQHMQQQNHHLQQHMQQQNQHLQQHMQRSQSQQPYTMYLQKQQQYATSVAASAAKNKGPVVSNGTGVADHSISISPVGTAKFPNANSGFPQNLVESPQWKSNSPRTTNTSQAQSPSILSPSSSVAASSSPRNVSHKQQSRPQQSQISFAANSKPTATGSPMQQVQGGTNNQAPSSPMLVGSPSTSSVSKTTGGSPRTSSSAVNKAGQASSTTHSSSQPSKNLQPASVASSAAVGRNNGPSVLGNQTTSSGSKSQQQQQQLPKHGLQQQAQLFFSNPYMQSQRQQQQITMSSSGGYYIQRHQQQPGSAACPPVVSTTGSVTATSDPAKVMVAAGNNIKGGGKTQQHQLGPPGFGLPYVHAVPSAVQVKPVDQKQQSGE
ncbi:PREDICTED: protein TIME FOR COFFEE-like isoform X1 [Brassica oleracea var. oleracea]|uniref:Protein TIME FOR COFFEE n=1 Tax=Brassica oleracea var. oleracea TaxID=109376 RepID=A0A0D3BCR3_BRAOL|nr:PREDICTED: protein TIME FOR COFFEE-like isoform X1 [Brassica oleracea var. oleracea]